VSGMLAVTELTDYLDVIDRLDAAIGPIKQRRRGHTRVSQFLLIKSRRLPRRRERPGFLAG